MSDQTINQLHPSLKDLNRLVEKLGRKVDRLDILAYRYQRLSTIYKQLAAQCQELFEILDHIDVAAFEIRQDYTLLREVCNGP